MRLEPTSCHVEITPALLRLVERKLAGLERILNDSALSADVVLTNERRARRADVTIHTRGEKFRHAVGASKDASIVGDRLGKALARPADLARAEGVRPRMPRILQASRQELRPMSVDDAASEVEANGEGVVVFRDADTKAISVLFRQANGELTLVETEA